MSIKPEDILSDNENSAVCNGVAIRKGSVAAALANADIFIAATTSESEKQAAKNELQNLASVLVYSSFTRHLVWKDPEIQKIFEEAEKNKVAHQ